MFASPHGEHHILSHLCRWIHRLQLVQSLSRMPVQAMWQGNLVVQKSLHWYRMYQRQGKSITLKQMCLATEPGNNFFISYKQTYCALGYRWANGSTPWMANFLMLPSNSLAGRKSLTLVHLTSPSQIAANVPWFLDQNHYRPPPRTIG
jgi:hypothetical protein